MSDFGQQHAELCGRRRRAVGLRHMFTCVNESNDFPSDPAVRCTPHLQVCGDVHWMLPWTAPVLAYSFDRSSVATTGPCSASLLGRHQMNSSA